MGEENTMQKSGGRRQESKCSEQVKRKTNEKKYIKYNKRIHESRCSKYEREYNRTEEK